MKKKWIAAGIVVCVLLLTGMIAIITGRLWNRQDNGDLETYRANRENYTSKGNNDEMSDPDDSGSIGDTDKSIKEVNGGDTEPSDSGGNKSDSSNVDKTATAEPMIIGVFGTDERSTETSRSDIIIVAKYDPVAHHITLLSIPRDTRVEIPGRGLDKINHAFAFGGAALLTETLEGLLQTEIDHYVRVSFEDFRDIIDTFGGVSVNAQKVYANSNNSIYIPKGESLLTGEEALYYVRFRKDSEGDFGRIKRQQEVIRSLVNAIIEEDRLVVTDKIAGIYNNELRTDINLDVILQGINDFDSEASMTYESRTLSTTSSTISGIWYELYEEDSLKEFINLLN